MKRTKEGAKEPSAWVTFPVWVCLTRGREERERLETPELYCHLTLLSLALLLCLQGLLAIGLRGLDLLLLRAEDLRDLGIAVVVQLLQHCLHDGHHHGRGRRVADPHG